MTIQLFMQLVLSPVLLALAAFTGIAAFLAFEAERRIDALLWALATWMLFVLLSLLLYWPEGLEPC